MSRIDRLDALPFTKKHRSLLVGSGAGWALDALDVGLISFVLVALTEVWGIGPGEKSAIATAGFVGMAIGASLGGLLADRFGRRNLFAITLLIFGIATGASALAWSVGALIVLRFFVGLGLGAELPVASTLVSEFAPPRIRGRIIVILEAFWAVGWFASALVGFLVVPNAGENGWRWALAIGAIPAIYSAVIRFGLPESVRFLESRGKNLEAENTVREFERAAGIDAPPVTSVPAAEAVVAAPKVGAGTRLRALFAPERRRQTIALWIIWFFVNFAYYGAFVWIPTLLVSQGYTMVQSFGYTLIITAAQLPGYAVSAYLVEKWGRGRTLAVFLVGSAIAAILFGSAGSTGTILAAGCLLSFFNLGAWGALYAVTPEVFPTALRGTGAGWSAGFGRIASIIAPIVVPLIAAATTGLGVLFTLFAACFAIAAIAALFLADKRGQALEEVNLTA